MNDAPDKEDQRQMIIDSPRGQIKFTYAGEILLGAIEFPIKKKSSGLDKTQSELFKYAPACFHVWLTNIFMMMFVHVFYLSKRLMLNHSCSLK